MPETTYSPDIALGKVLRAYREREPKRTQEDIGYNAGVTAATIGRIERGVSLAHEWATVRVLADALGVSLVELATAVEVAEGKLDG